MSPLPPGPQNSEQAALIASLPNHLKAWDVDENGCWVARKRQPNGYAVNTSWGGRPPKGKKGSVYKLIYEYVIGPVPEGLELDHLCDNGSGGCCNPWHLNPTTRRNNVNRTTRTIPGRHVLKTHCPQGHPYSGDNLIIEKRGTKIERHCRTCKYERTRAWQEKHREENRRKAREKYASDPRVRELARIRHQRAAEKRRQREEDRL